MMLCPYCHNPLSDADVDQLQSQNAKLRKLARMMWLACKSNGIVGGIYAYPDRNSNADEKVCFYPLLRELGIEVSNGQENQTQGEAAH